MRFLILLTTVFLTIAQLAVGQDRNLWNNESFGNFDPSKEIEERRSLNEKHFQRTDGQVEMYVSSEPINYFENGKWSTIYNTINTSTNGEYKFNNEKNIFKSYYSENVRDGFKTILNGLEVLEMRNASLFYEKNGEKIGFQSISDSKGKATNNSLKYESVYGNQIDLLITQTGGKRKLDYILKSKEAINSEFLDADYLVFSEEIVLPKGWSAKIEKGSILLLDESGHVTSLYEVPMVFDGRISNEEKPNSQNTKFDFSEYSAEKKVATENKIVESNDISYELIEEGSIITVLTKIRLEYLIDEDRVFPILVDPTLTASVAATATWYYDYIAPYGPATVTTSGAPAGSVITNVNVALNVTATQYYDWFWGWTGYTGNCNNYHVFGLEDVPFTLGTYTCGGNTSNYNCTSPNKTWRTVIWSVDGFDYRARWGYTITVTYETGATLGTLSNAGPIDFCDAGGNFGTALTVSGQTGSIMWDWGSNNGVWNNNWVAGAASGVCCFPKKVSNSDGNADRIRYRVTLCSSTVTSGTILIRNRFNEPPTSLASTSSNYCTNSAPANITLTATFPSSINMNGTVSFYSGSCGGTLVGSVVASPNSSTAAITIAAPASTTTYFVRYEPGAGTGCSNTACVSATVTVNVPSSAPTSITGTTTICLGSSTILTLSGGSPGTGAVAQWFTGSCGGTMVGTGNSITVSPATSTTYFVRYSGTCNTTICANTLVTVNTLSVAPTSIAGTTTICLGASTTLTLTGGSPGTGAVAQWFTGSCGGTMVGTGNSITVSPATSTTYFVRYSGTCNTTTCANTVVTVNTLSVAPTSIVGTTTICSGGSTTLTLSGGSPGTGAVAQWFTGSCGGTLVGTGNSVTVSPSSTITYFVRFSGTCNTTACASVVLTVNTLSTAITSIPVPASVCPNTNTTLTASGGTAGSGSTINWYTGPNGTGTLVGTGASIVVAPANTTNYYVRREGTCNTSSDFVATVTVKTFYYAGTGTTANNYCTDNSGWHHFYNGNQILFSVQGNISGAPAGYPIASIVVNGSYYQQTEGPGTPGGCASNQDPNEERFEMRRSWNLDFGGGAPSGTYNIRFYYQPAERTAIETAAANHMSSYPACGYTYKYATPLGFYWFKNSGSNYSAPLYDAVHYSATVGTAPGGINYAEWTGITGFSGGSGGVIIIPPVELPVDLTSFTALCDESATAVEVKWTTASEQNSSHFVVDRSLDGISWDEIGTVQAAGNSTTILNYSLLDDATVVRAHEVIYYRLNQFDNDGESKVYGPASAECSNSDLGMELFPNPASNLVNILLHGDYDQNTYVVFTDMQGKEVRRIQYNEQVGKLYSVDISDIVTGVYIVRLMDGTTNREFVRFVKR